LERNARGRREEESLGRFPGKKDRRGGGEAVEIKAKEPWGN